MSATLPRIQISPIVGGYLVLGLIAGAGVLWLLNGGARKTAAAVGALPANVAAGVVEGLGDSLGVPRTSESECDRALREGRLWDASFACPAGRFITGIFGGGEAPAPINRSADSSGVPFY